MGGAAVGGVQVVGIIPGAVFIRVADSEFIEVDSFGLPTFAISTKKSPNVSLEVILLSPSISIVSRDRRLDFYI